MEYRIQYNYNTGDSFNTYSDIERYLELTWKNLDVAKENLKRIREHYNQYKEINSYSYSKKNREDILGENKDKDWFVKENENCIILYTDDNKPFQFWAPWCGYFESLNHVEIVPTYSDMKIIF